ncbi:MAG TPA: SDR family oxidoreductase [Azospirillaceae bacterium]|nr:SDR family oxidoreductase [Azospirillaceae bacterium]
MDVKPSMAQSPALTNRYPSLAGKVVMVTGGASGIGACLVRHFVAQGARTCFIDRDGEAAAALADELGDRLWWRQVDVRDVAALQASLREAHADHGGRLDVLVSNAANDRRQPLDEVTPEDWDEGQAVNLRPHFFALQEAGRLMGPGGSIVTMGSVSWKRRRAGFTAYTTAKGGIHALTRTMAQELGPRGIRVNSVVPGAVVTERQLKLWVDPKLEQSFLDEQALKFRLMPEDIAAMVLFLASDDSRGCAGQDFQVDAGIV